MSTHSTAVKMAFAFLAVYRIVAILFMVVGSLFGVLFAYIVLSSEAPWNTKVAMLGFEIVFYIIFFSIGYVMLRKPKRPDIDAEMIDTGLSPEWRIELRDNAMTVVVLGEEPRQIDPRSVRQFRFDARRQLIGEALDLESGSESVVTFTGPLNDDDARWLKLILSR